MSQETSKRQMALLRGVFEDCLINRLFTEVWAGLKESLKGKVKHPGLKSIRSSYPPPNLSPASPLKRQGEGQSLEADDSSCNCRSCGLCIDS